MALQNSLDGNQVTVRDLANQWLAKFAPLISRNEVPYEVGEIRRQMNTFSSIRADAPELQLLEDDLL